RVARAGGDGVEYEVGAGVTGDVRAHLPAEPVAGANHVADLVRLPVQVAAIIRVGKAVEGDSVLAVRLFHVGGAVKNSAVYEELQRADSHPIVAVAEAERQTFDAFFRPLDGAVGAEANGHGGPRGQPAFFLELFVGAIALRAGVSLGDAGDAD